MTMCGIAKVDGKWCRNQGDLKKALGLDRLPIDPCYTKEYVGKDEDCLCPVNFDVLRKRNNLSMETNDIGDVLIET
jgi:hypothetical protein